MKKQVLWAIRFAVSFGIIFYLLRLIPAEKLLETLASVNVSLVIVSILLTQLGTYLSAIKSKILMDEHNMSLTVARIFKINYVTQFYGLFLPEVISSGLIRWRKLSTPDGKPAEALASMIFSRFTEVIFILCEGLLFWMLDKRPNSNDFLGMVLTILLFAGGVTYYCVFNRRISLFILGNFYRISFIPKQLIEKLQKLLMATSHYQGLKTSSLLKVLGLNLMKDMIAIFCLYLLARSVNIHIELTSIAWIRSCILILSLLPISVSGIGIQDGSLIFFLGSFGVSMPSTLVLSFLIYVRTFLGGAVGGLIQAADLVFVNQQKPEVNKIN